MKWKEYKVGLSHQIRTYNINKTFLKCFDDKKYIIDNGTKTLGYRHKDSNQFFKPIKY